MQMVTVVPSQGGQFQSVVPLTQALVDRRQNGPHCLTTLHLGKGAEVPAEPRYIFKYIPFKRNSGLCFITALLFDLLFLCS